MIPVGQKIELPGAVFLGEKKILGVQLGSNRFRMHMPQYIDLYKQGRLKLDEMITRRAKLERRERGVPRDEGGRSRAHRAHLRLTVSIPPQRRKATHEDGPLEKRAVLYQIHFNVALLWHVRVGGGYSLTGNSPCNDLGSRSAVIT